MSKSFRKIGNLFLHIFFYYLILDLKLLNAEFEKNYNPSIYKRQRFANRKKIRKFNNQKDFTIYYIAKKPNITIGLKNTKVLMDDQAIFVCACVGNPPPFIRWKVNEKDILPKHYSVENISPQKSVLRINPVKKLDNSNGISCQATSPMGSSYSHASLFVYNSNQETPAGFPVIVSKSSVIVNEKNTRVVLECHVKGNPKPEIIWLKDSAPVDMENLRISFLGNGALEINKTLEEDEGGYECIATNVHGTTVSPLIRLMIRENVEETYQLIMKNVSYFAPHFIYLPDNQVVAPGSSLTLKCRALGNPTPEVFWKCGQTILQPHLSNSTSQKVDATVILADLSESLNCTCVAKNSKEMISRTILVAIQEPSIVPTFIRISHVGATFCNVSWNQKAFREDELKYQVVFIKTDDFYAGKNTSSSDLITIRKREYEMMINKTITNLLPFTNYTVWLEAYPFKSDSFKSNSVSFVTLELPPNSAPRNVELSAISNGALIVMWDPPEFPNGIITNYDIYYTEYISKPLSLWNKYTVTATSKDNSKQHDSILTHLTNNIIYYISVSARNKAGPGPVSEPQAILVRAGVVQGPKNFRAIVKSPTEVQLFWEPLIPKTQLNVLFYELIYTSKTNPKDNGRQKIKYSPTESALLIGNLKPNTTYEFQLSAVTDSATGMTSVANCTTLIQICPSEMKGLILEATNEPGIKVCLSDLIINVHDEARITLTNNNDKIDFKINQKIENRTYCHHQTEKVKAKTNYSVSVFIKRKECQWSLTRHSSILTLSISIEVFINITAKVLNSTAVEVVWKTVGERKKEIRGYKLQCYTINEKSKTSKLVKSFTAKNMGEINKFIITNLQFFSQYQVHIGAIFNHGSGSFFKSNIIRTWPKKLEKLEYLYLRLSCEINQPCVNLEWKPNEKDKSWIKGYRIRYYPILDNSDQKFKIYEKNVSKTDYETSYLDHYQGFQYEFKVAAFSQYEIGEESVAQIFILEGTPSISPPDFKLNTLSPLSPTSVSFSWGRIPQHSLNGRFEQYQVWCFILTRENETSKFYSSKTESIVIEHLLEDSNYACRVRVMIQKASGLWSDPIYFKTKDAYLPPPEGIRMIRLSHLTAHITWKWKPEFLLHYSHFNVHYITEKDISKGKVWFIESTKSAFTKILLKSLNATDSYIIRVLSVSKRQIEGPLSEQVKETFLDSSSWPAKYVSELSCAPDTSTTIHLRWSARFDKQYLTHFRVNFTGITQFQSDKSLVSKIQDEQEQSTLVSEDSSYYSHQIWNLKPNTRYTIGIEPIFGPGSNTIGTSNYTICTTFREPPSALQKLILSNIKKTTNEIVVSLSRPNTENGSIDVYYIVVRVSERSAQNSREKRSNNKKEEILIEDLMKSQSNNDVNNSKLYITLSVKHEEIFPLGDSSKKTHKITVGTGKVEGTFRNRKLNPDYYYQLQVFACIQAKESLKVKFQCKASPWSTPINIKLSVPIDENKLNTNNNNNYDKTTSYRQSSKGPSTFTTTTVVVILGVVILVIIVTTVVLFIKRRKIWKSKLGSAYSSHSNRMNKEKSVCMEHLLKEPTVDSSYRISTSGSLRFKNQGNNYLEVNKIQLSSTPDLLVRSSVPQPLNSLVQFHGQQFQSRFPDYAPIPVEALAEHVAVLKENDGRLFTKEYESIEPGQQFTWSASNLEINRFKNRYANVIAYDHSRVILQPLYEKKNHTSNETQIVPGSDYINANYISGYHNTKAYIATQGPLADTIGDFWRMMWEQNSSVIVMMTRLEERDRTKCDQYWPLGGRGSNATYSYINVTIIDVTELAYYTIRKFHIQKTNGDSIREIFQLQFTAWPDHGVPNHPAPLLMFLRRVHSEIPRNCGPIVVHCSAGVGRTGAFIVIDYMLERLRYENSVDIYNYVTNIRSQRNYMVQTEDQYIFIYETLLEAVQCGNTEVPVSELATHIEKLNQIEISHKTLDGIQMTGLQMEFENLVLSSEGFLQGIKLNANNHSHCSTPSTTHGNIVTNYQPLTYETATQLVNQMKNRIMQILPPDFSRVNICPIRGVEGSDYINASWIDGYKSRKAYIAAQSPLSETCEDFWRTLWEHNSSIIVMLTLLKENNRERCYQYWPSKKSSRYQFFIVDPVAEYNMTTYVIREFKLTDTRDSQSRVIRQFQFTDWQESESIPHSTQVFLDLINQVHKTKVQLGHDGPIVVHCSAGSGRTGIFLALSNIIERMKNESVIDLFQTVKLLRWQRPALLQTEDQYQFCYMAALEYLKFFEQMCFDL